MLGLLPRTGNARALSVRAFASKIDENLQLWKTRASKEAGGKDPDEALAWDTPDVSSLQP